MIILGITGLKQSGKTTAATVAVEKFGFTSLAFADPLKREVAEATGETVEFIEKNKSVFRPLLQWWGTDYRRGFYGSYYWIDKWEQAVRYYQACGIDKIVVPDVRFPNEAEAIRNVCKPYAKAEILRIRREAASSSDTHPSETEMSKIKHDAYIDNNRCLDLFNKEIYSWLLFKYGHH